MATLRPARLLRRLAHSAGAPAPLHLVFGSHTIPHPEKASTGGEDAFFADDASGTFGVADGVGGSARDGVDPGLFSREMLRHCRRSLSSDAAPGSAAPLRRALGAAAVGVGGLGGSSTVLLGQLSADHSLRLLNLGDSGAMLLRPSRRRFPSGTFLWPRVVLRTFDQTHYFNCPYQVAADDFARAADAADELCVRARDGDVLVAATDGVLDNLFDAAIQVQVAQRAAELRDPRAASAQRAVDALAAALAEEASAAGHREDDKELRTPFSEAALQEGYRFDGGKLDDVAVVCAVVRQGERPPARRMDNFRE